MHLKVYGPNDSVRVLLNIQRLDLEFNRNVYTVTYVDLSGRAVTVSGELTELVPKGAVLPDYLFDMEVSKPVEDVNPSVKTTGPVITIPPKVESTESVKKDEVKK